MDMDMDMRNKCFKIKKLFKRNLANSTTQKTSQIFDNFW